MKLRLFAATILAALASSSPLHATPQVLEFSNFYFTNGDALTGTVTIDTATGSIAGENFTVAGNGMSFAFNGIANVLATSNSVYTAAAFQTPDAYLDLLLPVQTLVGYTGGFTCVEGFRANCVPAGKVNSDGTFFLYGSSVAYAYAGLLTPVQSTTATPEPGSLTLLATGLLSAGAVRRRRRGGLRRGQDLVRRER